MHSTVTADRFSENTKWPTDDAEYEDFSTLTSLCLSKAELTPTNHLASEYPPCHLSLMARKILEPRVRNINWIVRTQNKVYLWLR